MQTFHRPWPGPTLTFLIVVFAGSARGEPSLEVLHGFVLNDLDGPSQPDAGLIESEDGNFYGTTLGGGAAGMGTIFKMTPAGDLTTLHSFSGSDGSGSTNALVESADENFYGTTRSGGAGGGGTVFRITPAGELTTVHSFSGPDGSGPYAALIESTDGNFYGTTLGGGAFDSGTVFRLAPSGALTTLHSFSGPDGSSSYAALVESADGNFYGTTNGGGAGGGGTVFKITPAGDLTTLHSFSGPFGPGGNFPYDPLIESADGNFYGTTFGNSEGLGSTVFRITPAGDLATLHSFSGPDGVDPNAALIESVDGNFYGTTRSGGDQFCCTGSGTVFRITPAGELTTLHSFSGPDGRWPFALVESVDGSIYGTTQQGGPQDGGVVFRLDMPSFFRGECNHDDAVDISDTVCTLDWLFTGKATPSCIAALNANGDEAVDIADAVWLLNFLFGSGAPPVAPFPGCGPASLAVDFDFGCATLPKSCQ